MVEDKSNWDYWCLRVGRDVSAIALFIALPLIGIIAHRSAPAVVAFAVLSVLIAHLLTGGRHWNATISHKAMLQDLHTRRWFGSPILPALLLFYWATVSLAWSLDPASGAKPLIAAALLIPAAWLLSLEYRHLKIASIDVILIAGVLVFSCYMLVERVFGLQLYTFMAVQVADPITGGKGAALHDVSRPLALVTMVLWAIWRGKELSLGLNLLRALVFSAGVLALFLSVSESLQLALIISAVTGIGLLIFPRLGLVPFFAIALIILVFPFVVNQLEILEPILELPALGSGGQLSRIYIWEQYKQFVLAKPVLGWGLGSERILGEMGGDSEMAYLFGITRKTAHAHSFIMQIWTELGLIGAFLCAWLAVELGRTAVSWQGASGTAVTQLLVAFFIYSSVSHQITQTWWLATIAASSIPYLLLRHNAKSSAD